jgi:hypothetical protein
MDVLESRMFDRRNSRCASHFPSGAPVAQILAKSLKSFAPVAKSSGANEHLQDVFGHKKTLRNRMVGGKCASGNLNFLRKLSTSGALVNTPTAVRLK